ncbi:TPA: hypothetical protein VCQ19_001457 [Streptococcus pyogenes]|nr:hypothetical protein [Streptococcus pyogenes]HEP3987041.1 hypothetical protein [Streptococcus pyogenes]
MIPKFRAWDKRFSEFVEDFFVSEDGKIYKKTKDTGYGIAISRETSDKIILMQSTGLIDRNGQDVFVGDIIKCTRGCPHEVYIEKEYAGTFIGGMPAIYLKGLSEGYAWTGDEEIIGNIYENKGLLEEEK